ncbi:MAG: NAD(P)-dependent oxidoreductase [Pseudomonadota bacterium]|nr:NAD(P)-dependent oxidoreductase [Pseudomonadota bacterium]
MRVGFVGIGAMGHPMAANILEAGYELRVFDVKEKSAKVLAAQGAITCPDLEVLAKGSEVVMMSLPGPKEVKGVATEILESLSPGKVLIDLSTNSPSLIREIDSIAKFKKVDFLDAPVSGGTYGAKKGELTVMVGGGREQFEALEPLWNCIGSNIFHVGKVGSGNIAKLVNNMLAFSNMMSNAEALVLGAKAGIDPNVLWGIVKTSSGSSVTWIGGVKAILKDRLDPNFTVNLACKDIDLAADLAAEVGVDLPMASVAKQLLGEFRSNGFANEDILSTIKAFEGSAGVSVRGVWKD